MNFIALDFETANRNRSSICQVGIAEFRDGRCEENTSWLVDPREDFDHGCVAVHGITPEQVRGAPTFDTLYESTLGPLLAGKVVVCHTSFDRVALDRACELHGYPAPEVSWLDSATLARRVWPEVSRSGYGLKNLAVNRLGIEFRHHDAGEDARAAGLVVLAAAESLGMGLDECLGLLSSRKAGAGARQGSERTKQARVTPTATEAELSRLLADLVARTAGLEDPPLAGETVVITGKVQIPKKDVGAAVERLGGVWEEDLTSRATMLVVGRQNPVALKGKKKSEKHLEAEALIEKGQELQIFSEAEWLELLRAVYEAEG